MRTKTYLTEIIVATGFLSVISAGAFGAFGAIVHFLYLIAKEVEDFSVSRLFIFSIMGFFVGIVADQIMLMSIGQSYPGIILISGFLFLKILELIDNSGLSYLTDKIIPRK